MSEVQLRDADYERRYDEAAIRMLTGTRWCVYCGETDDLEGPCDIALDRRQGRRLTSRWEDVYERRGRERKLVNRQHGLVFVQTETGPWHYVAHGIHETALRVWADSAMWREIAGLGDRTRPGTTAEPELRAAARAAADALDWTHERWIGRVCVCGHHRIAHGATDSCRLCDCRRFSRNASIQVRNHDGSPFKGSGLAWLGDQITRVSGEPPDPVA